MVDCNAYREIHSTGAFAIENIALMKSDFALGILRVRRHVYNESRNVIGINRKGKQREDVRLIWKGRKISLVFHGNGKTWLDYYNFVVQKKDFSRRI